MKIMSLKERRYSSIDGNDVLLTEILGQLAEAAALWHRIQLGEGKFGKRVYFVLCGEPVDVGMQAVPRSDRVQSYVF